METTEPTNNKNVFDVSRYSVLELENLFRLRKPYTIEDINFQKKTISEQLNMENVDTSFKNTLDEFLDRVQYVLAYNLQHEKSTTPLIQSSPTLSMYNASTYMPSFQTRVDAELMNKPYYEVTPTYHQELRPGKLNPFRINTLTKNITIDSKYRDNYYGTSSSNFNISLPFKLANVVSMQLTSFEMPISFYGVSSALGNNFFYVGVTYTDANGNLYADSKIVDVSDGNYCVEDMIYIINQKLAPTSNGAYTDSTSMFNYIQLSLDITDYSGSGVGSGTGKISIKSSSASITSIILDFKKDINGNDDAVSIRNKMGWNLGFRYEMYENATSYTAETLPNFSTINYVYLLVDDFTNSLHTHIYNAFKTSYYSKSILARIPIKVTYFNILMENDLKPYTEPRVYFGPIDITRFNLQLVDENGKNIDMNNADFSVTFTFKQLYDN